MFKLHIMIENNPRNIIENKIFFFYVYHGGLEYICTK
jgi:hypothetical protein